ncbi:Gdpd3 [Symbiodinium natans]|uniref:Gdpd3 protein n=1 Tax=Symbiodinium natans TaxID=878477 RepID=A0A812SUA4_9DINO|nr:Gdpd3 [Symbiodinium natans]
MEAKMLRVPLLREGGAGTKPLLVAHRGGAGEAPENTLESLKYCMDQKVPLVQMDVMQTKDGQLVLFHDLPLEKNLEKLTGVAGDISNYDYDALPDFKTEFEASPFFPPGSKPVPVGQRRMSLFRDACRALATSEHTDIILEFWQESEAVVLETLKVLREFGLQNRVAAWGSPEIAAIQQWCRNACPEIPVIVTFKQSFVVWFFWNVGLLRFPDSAFNHLLPKDADTRRRGCSPSFPSKSPEWCSTCSMCLRASPARSSSSPKSIRTDRHCAPA